MQTRASSKREQRNEEDEKNAAGHRPCTAAASRLFCSDKMKNKVRDQKEGKKSKRGKEAGKERKGKDRTKQEKLNMSPSSSCSNCVGRWLVFMWHMGI